MPPPPDRGRPPLHPDERRSALLWLPVDERMERLIDDHLRQGASASRSRILAEILTEALDDLPGLSELLPSPELHAEVQALGVGLNATARRANERRAPFDEGQQQALLAQVRSLSDAWRRLTGSFPIASTREPGRVPSPGQRVRLRLLERDSARLDALVENFRMAKQAIAALIVLGEPLPPPREAWLQAREISSQDNNLAQVDVWVPQRSRVSEAVRELREQLVAVNAQLLQPVCTRQGDAAG